MKDLKNVRLFLMDMDGTVYVGDNKIAGAFEALEELRRRGKKVCFLTNNSSKSTDKYVEKLAKMGYVAEQDSIFSSAVATVGFLKNERKDKKIFLVANSDVYKYFKEQGINLVEEDADIVVLCFDTELNYQKLVKASNMIFEGKEYIATHPDFVCPASPYPIPDVGSFIELLYTTTHRRPDIIIGKPYAEMAKQIALKYGLQPDEIAMCGDRLYTDIKFAENNGMYGILVMTGETTADMLKESDAKPDLVLDTFADVLKLI